MKGLAKCHESIRFFDNPDKFRGDNMKHPVLRRIVIVTVYERFCRAAFRRAIKLSKEETELFITRCFGTAAFFKRV